MQLTLEDVKRRIARLAELERGLAPEIGMQREDDGLLLFRERKRYLAGTPCGPPRPRQVWPSAAASAKAGSPRANS
jgi:hypothetical protein